MENIDEYLSGVNVNHKFFSTFVSLNFRKNLTD